MRTLYTYNACGHSRLGRTPPSGWQRVTVPGECQPCRADHACRCTWESFWYPRPPYGLAQDVRRIGEPCPQCQRDKVSAHLRRSHAWEALQAAHA